MKRESGEQRQLLFALGLCARARRLIFGVPMICEALKKGKTDILVVAASDNSENSAKRLRDRCEFYNARLCVTDVDGETLASATGKGGRIAAVAVTDPNMIQLVLSKLNTTNQNENSES